MVLLDEVDSTMLEAERRIEAGAALPFLLCARAQRGGTGRYGRAWASPPGNLYWTLALARLPDWPRDFGLTFAAGLAVADALVDLGVPADRLRLKWPNDVLLDRRKVAGVLIRMGQAGRVDHAVIGIGVNLQAFPSDAVFPATSLAQAGFAAPLADARAALTTRFADRLAEWLASGFAGMRPELVRRLHGVGEPVQVALDGGRTIVVAGVNNGLDPAGGLILAMQDGTSRIITAGDVLS